MPRTGVVLSISALVAAAWSAAPVAPTAVAATTGVTRAAADPCPPPSGNRHDLDNAQDLDGDSHVLADSAVGASHSGSGAVDIRYDGGRFTQRVDESFFDGLPAPGASDRFGTSVAYVNVDRNTCNDLAIGAPGADDGTGAVVLALGGNQGVVSQGAVRLTGRTPGEHFGWSIWVSNVNIFVGAPDRTVSGHSRAGAVDWYQFDLHGQVHFVQSITQDTPGVPGVAETGDRFGRVLAAGMIGDPDEAVGSAAFAGTVTTLELNGTQTGLGHVAVLSRNTTGIPGRPEAGDRFGYAITNDLNGFYIGVPGAKVGGAARAGAVYEVLNSLSGWHLTASFTEDTAGVPGAAEPGDHFGAALSGGTFTNCGRLVGDPSTGSDVAIGAPGEDAGSVRDVGAVTIIPTGQRDNSLLCGRAYHQSAGGGLGGAAEAGDRLGAALARVGAPYDFLTGGGAIPVDQLQIGVPGEDIGAAVDAGGVTLTTYVAAPKPELTVASYHDTAGIKAGEQYGGSLGASPGSLA